MKTLHAATGYPRAISPAPKRRMNDARQVGEAPPRGLERSEKISGGDIFPRGKERNREGKADEEGTLIRQKTRMIYFVLRK